LPPGQFTGNYAAAQDGFDKRLRRTRNEVVLSWIGSDREMVGAS